MKTYKCTHCGVTYTPNWKPKGTPFCSRSCSNIHNPRRSPEHKCKQCDKAINNLKKFCSDYCKATYLASIPRQSSEDRSRQLKRAVVSFRIKQKARAVEYKGGKCVNCSYSKCIDALEFHHIDPSEKDFCISGKSLCWDRLRPELDKCILVCSNCHRELHSKKLQG